MDRAKRAVGRPVWSLVRGEYIVMKFPPEIIESVRSTFGYTDREARFLFLVATHSGHFLARHFLAFTGTSRGSVLRDFIAKAARKRHIREALYSGNGARRYHVFSKPLYAALGKIDSSHRRAGEASSIVVKLLTLDFVLRHLEADYLDEERDKVSYFHEELGIDKAFLPFRAYKPANTSTPPTIRYFVDKFPIFMDPDGVVSFVYVDDPLLSTQAFRTHLVQYSGLFHRLPRPFRVWFASAVPGKFLEAERVFRGVVTSKGPSLDRELSKYFNLRRRWEARDLSGFTPKLLREHVEMRKKYSAAPFDQLYTTWLSSFGKPASSTQMRADFSTFEVRA
jgi:hypothetical protein